MFIVSCGANVYTLESRGEKAGSVHLKTSIFVFYLNYQRLTHQSGFCHPLISLQKSEYKTVLKGLLKSTRARNLRTSWWNPVENRRDFGIMLKFVCIISQKLVIGLERSFEKDHDRREWVCERRQSKAQISSEMLIVSRFSTVTESFFVCFVLLVTS